MKKFTTFLLMFLLLAPPMQAHTDIVIEETFSDVHNELNIDNIHQEEHHQNDSDEDKDTDHHHHCSIISTSNIFIKEELELKFLIPFLLKQKLEFYKNLQSSSYLENPFQPPKFI